MYEEVIESRDEVEIATYDAMETAVNAVEIASETPLDVVETAAQWNVMGIENEETGYVTGTWRGATLADEAPGSLTALHSLLQSTVAG